MKIFIDTNIFLDLILKREEYQAAVMILNAVDQSLFEASILDITLLNIDYIAKKQIKEVRSFLTLVNTLFNVLGATNDSMSQALKIQNSDLEDNLQYVGAKISNCDLIISNDKDFYNADIRVISSKEFVLEYL